MKKMKIHLRDERINNKFGPQSKNLASIIRGFKIGVTKYARQNNIKFQWQSRFYDRIIRDEKSLNNIQEYIINNPFNWEYDRNHFKNYAPGLDKPLKAC